jgi:hypothetical protein
VVVCTGLDGAVWARALKENPTIAQAAVLRVMEASRNWIGRVIYCWLDGVKG